MKKMPNTIIKLLIAVLSFLLIQACRPEEKAVTFAIASDFHAPDIPDGTERLASFIKASKDANVDFIIELGDFCRLDSVSQVYLEEWENFHFIVLDGNNLYDGKTYRHYAKANYYVDPGMRAFVDPEQMEWLKKDLAATDKKCILFSHQSIDAFMNNGADVRRVLEEENKRSGFKKVVLAFSGHNHSNYTKEINGITYIQINSASYVWIDEPSMTEKRYPKEINEKYALLKYSITYDKPLYAIVTLSEDGAEVKGTKADFIPPTPQDLHMEDSIGGFPLVSVIENVKVSFHP